MRTTDVVRASRAPVGALLAMVALGACMPPPGRQAPHPERPAAPHARIAAKLLYTRDLPDGSGQLLQRMDLSDGRSETLMRLSEDQTALPLGADPDDLIQVLTDKGHEISAGHFHADPHLAVHDRSGRLVADLGRGGFAHRHPEGHTIAWAAPIAVRTCEDGEEPCELPPSQIVMASLDDPDRVNPLTTLDEVNRVWWLDLDRLIVEQTKNRSTLAWSDGRTSPGPEGRIRDVAPGAGLVLLGDDDLRSLWLSPPEGEPAWRHSFDPRRGDGVVTPDGSQTLVQSVEARPDHTAATSLLVLDAAGSEASIKESRSDGNLLWSSSSSAFAYRRAFEDGSAFELTVCWVGPLVCRDVWSWTEGVEILALSVEEEPS